MITKWFSRSQIANILDLHPSSIIDLEKKYQLITPARPPSSYTIEQLIFLKVCYELRSESVRLSFPHIKAIFPSYDYFSNQLFAKVSFILIEPIKIPTDKNTWEYQFQLGFVYDKKEEDIFVNSILYKKNIRRGVSIIEEEKLHNNLDFVPYKGYIFVPQLRQEIREKAKEIGLGEKVEKLLDESLDETRTDEVLIG